MTDEIVRLFKKAAIKAVVEEGVPGLIGAADGTIYYTDEAGVKHRDLVWARIGEGAERQELVVHAPTVQKVWDLPIIIADRGGTPTAIRTDWLRSNIFTGGRSSDVSQHSWTHQRLGIDPLYIVGQSFLPLMARPTSPADMTVTVEQGFYRYHGTEKVFEQTVSASMASFVPSATTFHFVIICLDRDANTLYILDGSDQVQIAIANVLTTITGLNDKFFPLAAIRFYGNQTAIYATDIIHDLRLWGGELTNFSAIMTDVDTNIMIDANGDVMVGL